MRSFDNSRSSISLQTRVEELIPVEEWNRVRGSLQARSWPELVAPPRIVALRTALPPIFFFGTYGVLHIWFAELILINMIISGVFAGIIGRLVRRFTKQYNRLIPEKMTVKDLLFFVTTSDEISWTREQVSERVRKIVIEQLGLSENQYFEDADFIEDLGMD